MGLNLAMVGGLIYWALIKPSASVTPVVVAAAPQTKVVVTPINTNPPVAESKPFRWSQLDAKDYHDYVKNLRAFGCPEPTIRAIVTADVHAVYILYGRELERKLTDITVGSWSTRLANSELEQQIKARLQQLTADESVQIDDYLGRNINPVVSLLGQPTTIAVSDGLNFQQRMVSNPQSGSLKPDAILMGKGASVSNTATALADDSAAKPLRSMRLLPQIQEPVALPLAFQTSEESAQNLNENQMQIVTDLRQGFFDKIGASSQNPSDPAYLKRWQAEQDALDRLMYAQLGETGYFNYEMTLHPFQH